MMQIARRVLRVRPHLTAIGVVLALGTPTVAHARHVVFAETWENGTDNWRTQLANGGDCKGWPTCPFNSATQETGPTFPAALLGNTIQVRDHDGADARDANTCSGKYVNIPRAVAGWDAANLAVQGAITQGGNVYKNAQFPVKAGDRLCVVAWIRAYPELDAGGAPTEAGPYVGIHYTGAHGVVDAGHNHCTHYMIGPAPWGEVDPEVGCTWWEKTPAYGALTPIVPDGQWHRYKNSFPVHPEDVANTFRKWSPELTAIVPKTTWQDEAPPNTIVFGQPRLILFGKAPERIDTPAGTPLVNHDADFGDIYFYKADNAVEDPCPPDADLDALSWASDHVACAAGRNCVTSVADLPAFDRTIDYPANTSSVCVGCASSFGAAPPGPTVCAETVPFCVGAGIRGGTCTACGGDAASGAAPGTKCADATPTCFTEGALLGACGKCADNASCADPAHPGPNCDPVSGGCFACTGDNGSAGANPCPATAPRCDAATKLCGKCAWNDECAGADHGGPLCDVATGACTSCASDFGAAAGPTTCPAAFPLCLTAPLGGEPVGVCGMCATATDCVNPAGKTTHPGPMCDGTTGACGKCDGDLGTSTTAYACVDGALPTCRTDGSCGKCASDVDCTNPPGQKLHTLSVCNLGTGACEGPPAPVPKCDGDKDTSTTADACADPAAPTCRADGTCGKCTTDNDCANPPGEKLHSLSVCNVATGACDQGPPAVVPPAVDGGPGGGPVGQDGGCSSSPARTPLAGFGAASVFGIFAAFLFALRRKRRAD